MTDWIALERPVPEYEKIKKLLEPIIYEEYE